MQPFDVSPDRVEKSQKIIAERISKLSVDLRESTMLAILQELNMYDQVNYDSFGMLQFYLTDLQWVALGAAVIAVTENNAALIQPLSTNVSRAHLVIESVNVDETTAMLGPSAVLQSQLA